MVSGNYALESLLNSFQVVKDALSPQESGIKDTKDFEFSWLGSKSGRHNAELLGVVDGPGNAGINVKNSKNHISPSKKKNRPSPPIDEGRRKGLSIELPMKTILGVFLPNCVSADYKVNVVKKQMKEGDWGKAHGSCLNCLQLVMTWSVLLNGFVQAFQGPFKMGKKQYSKLVEEERVSKFSSGCMSKSAVLHEMKKRETKKFVFVMMPPTVDTKPFGLELLINLIFDRLTQNIPQLSKGVKQNGENVNNVSSLPSPTCAHLDHWKAVTGLLEGRKEDVNIFLGNLNFARVGGMTCTLVGVTSHVKEDSDDGMTAGSNKESGGLSPQKLAGGLLNIPLSNVERLKTTLSSVSVTELIELVPQFVRSSRDIPDKKKLFSVQDFFRYTKAEGRRFFEELDRDGDGQVNLADLKIAMRKRKLPDRYARDFMRRARAHLFASSFGWKQLQTLMEQKEPTILRAYTSLCLSKSGTLQKSEILASLKNAELPASEDNAVAMIRFLNADAEGSVSYGHFRNFMLFLPSDRLQDDPRNVWFEAATVVPVAPPVEMPAGSVLRSALAGGLASGLSTSLLLPIDTIKPWTTDWDF